MWGSRQRDLVVWHHPVHPHQMHPSHTAWRMGCTEATQGCTGERMGCTGETMGCTEVMQGCTEETMDCIEAMLGCTA